MHIYLYIISHIYTHTHIHYTDTFIHTHMHTHTHKHQIAKIAGARTCCNLGDPDSRCRRCFTLSDFVWNPLPANFGLCALHSFDLICRCSVDSAFKVRSKECRGTSCFKGTCSQSGHAESVN